MTHEPPEEILTLGQLPGSFNFLAVPPSPPDLDNYETNQYSRKLKRRLLDLGVPWREAETLVVDAIDEAIWLQAEAHRGGWLP